MPRPQSAIPVPQSAIRNPQSAIPFSPRAAYIHVPFCAHRCGYCNFALVAGHDELVPAYLGALEKELSALGSPRPVETLYLGGGTPTQLAATQLDALLALVGHWHPLAPDGELTVEANPADLDAPRAEALGAHGVTRVSLGGQSFHAAKLARLERNHGPADIGRAAEAVRRIGAALALDLIFAAPGETLADWHADLDGALALEPDHVSTYGLTYEKGTTFWGRRLHGDLVELDDELQRSMYEAAIDRLTAADYEQYEVSNFALPGQRSRHNETYWTGESYYGAGPGAARYTDGRRETNHRSLFTWLQRIEAGESPVAEQETIDDAERAREQLVFGLRRLEGVKRDTFRQRTGFDLDDVAGASLPRHVELGLLTDDGHTVRLTREGLMVSDGLWPEYL